jgi:hypothetical protein
MTGMIRSSFIAAGLEAAERLNVEYLLQAKRSAACRAAAMKD